MTAKAKTEWKVELVNGPYVTLEADWTKVENGALTFRNHVRNSYPETVQVFAAGTWIRVENLSVVQP